MTVRLNFYLLRQIFTAFIVSSVAVTVVVLFTQTFYLLSFVIDNASSLVVFFKLAGLMVPTFLPLVVPISFGIAVLFSYHKASQDSEIVVMRAAGISPLRLALPALSGALVVIALGYVLTLWLVPASHRALVALQYSERDNHSIQMIRPGAFNDLDKGVTFYARRRNAGGGMQDILLHDVRNPELPVTVMAQSGTMVLDNGQPRIEVFNGRRQELDVKTGQLRELEFKKYILDFNLLKTKGSERSMAPREMPTRSVWRVWRGLEQTRRAPGKIRAELHQRLAAPLLTLSFAFVAVTVILVGPFNRRGAGRRVMIAAAAMVIIQATMIGLSNQVARQAGFAPILYFVIVAPWPVCLALLDARSSLARWLRPALTGDTE